MLSSPDLLFLPSDAPGGSSVCFSVSGLFKKVVPFKVLEAMAFGTVGGR